MEFSGIWMSFCDQHYALEMMDMTKMEE